MSEIKKVTITNRFDTFNPTDEPRNMVDRVQQIERHKCNRVWGGNNYTLLQDPRSLRFGYECKVCKRTFWIPLSGTFYDKETGRRIHQIPQNNWEKLLIQKNGMQKIAELML